MSDADNAFTEATNDLIALYRSVERRTLDLPWLSFMPFLIYMWEVIKFIFFFSVGLYLLIPVNLIILVRNLFPGHWKYRPFFLRPIYKLCLWVWRGEAPAVPIVFVRPLFIAYVKAHFETRLRRLRLEVALQDAISEDTRKTLMDRLNAALDEWKSPRFGALLFSIILPAVISAPAWIKQVAELPKLLGINLPIGAISAFIPKISHQNLLIIGSTVVFYLLSVPLTSILAKRGLFIGRQPNRFCFPGGQDGAGAYSKEREILASVGLHAREPGVDFWLLAVSIFLILVLDLGMLPKILDFETDFIVSLTPGSQNLFATQVQLLKEQTARQVQISVIIYVSLWIVAFVVSAIRRGRTGRL